MIDKNSLCKGEGRSFMKRIYQDNDTYNKHLGISMILATAMVLIVGIVYFQICMNQMMDNVKDEALVTMKSVSSQNIKILTNIIREKQKVLGLLAMRLERDEQYNIEEIIDELKLYVNVDHAYSMGVIDKNGICYTTLGKTLNLSQYDYFIDSINGEHEVTNSYRTQDGEELINILTTPVYKQDQVELIITVAYRSRDFSQLLNVNSFDGNGRSVVATLEDGIVTTPDDTEEISSGKEYLIHKEKQDIANIVRGRINETKKGSLSFEYNDKAYFAYYEPTGINDWFLISYVPKDYLYKNVKMVKGTIYKGSTMLYITCIILLGSFIREHLKYKKRMTQLVFFDELTGEKNEQYLYSYFKRMSKKEKKEHVLVVMDIDKFKSINLIYGSEMGDQVLQYIPCVFREALPEDKLFKYQADVFVAVVKGTSEEITDKINKLERRISKDIERKSIVPLKLYFGVCALDEFNSLNSIYNNALIAKNTCKNSIDKTIQFFDKEDKDKMIENRKIELDFTDALKHKEFEVWYQPKYNIKTGKIYGAEALVRWCKEDGSLIPPLVFIPVLENTGQIIQLDEAVIEMVFQDIQQMKEEGLPINPISINLSRVQAMNSELVVKIKNLMTKYKINPYEISFEITETALIENSVSINKIIEELHQIGIKVDIDDYGIGNSTLRGLFVSNFDTLKLDKTFCDHIGASKMDTIIEHTVRMAKELNMTVIAEGVETKEQAEFLARNNCNIAQGYYFSKPLSKKEYFSLIKKAN